MNLFDHRYRGFRVINFAAFGLVLILALGVYLAKTNAGREAAAINRIDRQIASEKSRIRNLHAEVAALERPDRIGKLSTEHLGMIPVDAKHEAGPEKLPELAGAKAAAAATPVSPTVLQATRQ